MGYYLGFEWSRRKAQNLHFAKLSCSKTSSFNIAVSSSVRWLYSQINEEKIENSVTR